MFPRGLLREYASLLTIVARVSDVVAVVIGASIAFYWRFHHLQLPSNYQIAILISTLLVLGVFPVFGIYGSWRGKSRFVQLRTITVAWVSVLLVLIVIAYLTKTGQTVSRQWTVAWGTFAWTLMLLFRVGLGQGLRFIRKKGWNHKRVVIVGAGRLGRDVERRLSEYAWTGFDIVGFVDNEPVAASESGGKVQLLGDIKSLGDVVEKKRIDEVWIALPLKDEERVKRVFHSMRHSTATIRFVPDIFGFNLLNHSVTEIAGLAVLDLSITPMVGLNRVVKAFEDRVLCMIILLLISPVMLVIAIGVKLSSPGPVFFRQLRHGWDGRPFEVYKFRTMVVHDDQHGEYSQARKGDPRVTRFGAFLRKTSLDELPQFLNVMQGHMSIVGPRPHPIPLNDKHKDLVDAYMQRHKVKPGITGWAQVNGWRGETDTLYKMKKRVEYDLYYIENWSLWFDLKVIFMTLFRGFRHPNAY